MSRLLLAGLFIFSLAVYTGCEASGGEAVKGKSEAKPTGISGDMGTETEDGKSGALPAPPKLEIPAGYKQ